MPRAETATMLIIALTRSRSSCEIWGFAGENYRVKAFLEN